MSTQKILKVIDSSLTLDNPKRVHQILVKGEIIDIPFVYGEDTLLQEHIALKFSKEGFRIVDPENDQSFDIPRETPVGAPMLLKEDEVIAKFTELTDESLRTRAIILPNGEKFIDGEHDRDELIDFLMGKEDVLVEDVDENEVSHETDDDSKDAEGNDNTESDAENTSDDESAKNDDESSDDAKDTQGQVDEEDKGE